MEYNSPIQTVVTEVTNRVKEDAETAVMEAVWSCKIDVDKEELLRALSYDRGMYEKGYHDGALAGVDLTEWVEIRPYHDGHNLYLRGRCKVCGCGCSSIEGVNYCSNCGRKFEPRKEYGE